jgi:alanine racemase
LNYTLKDIANIVHAQNEVEQTFAINQISIDSRSLHLNPNTLFFCLVGPQHDGHHFIDELIEKGIKNFVVSEPLAAKKDDANFILVENTTMALQQLAKHHRHLFNFPVLAITGSNGKTIVKEWLNYLINPEFHVVRSPKSFNSQIGVPLSLLTFNESFNFGIIEAGISQTNEMTKLEDIISPTYGLLTNIGSAHDEGFSSTDEKINEKTTLFKNVEVFFGEYQAEILNKLNPHTKTFTWSFTDKKAQLYVQIVDNAANEDHMQTTFNIAENLENYFIELPFKDEASVQNALHCILIMRFLKYDYPTIKERVKYLFPLSMRLAIKQGINNTLLIDDSYSADYHSLKIALDTLENLKQHTKKTVILSDIAQSGKTAFERYNDLYNLLEINKIDRIIVIGHDISLHFSKHANVTTYESTKAFISQIDHLNFQNESILIKGARLYSFEKIVQHLQVKEHETRLEINLNALSHNFHYYKSKLEKSTKVMAMIKAFGYGNGGIEIAKELVYHKVDYLGVAYADEGVTLRNNKVNVPIMVLNPEINTYEKMLRYQLEPEIYNIRGFKQFAKLAKDAGQVDYPIHIKIDTGMHRLGFDPDDLTGLTACISENPHLRIATILSHLVASDNLVHKAYTLQQIERFKEAATTLSLTQKNKPLWHILNTSGIANYPDAQLDMVRLGLGLYGVTNEPYERGHLQNVATLKSVISQIKSIKKGDNVSYNRTFTAPHDMIIATIPIGYADGIRRVLGNGNGYVSVKNQKAKIVGTICMDMMMIDISHISCDEGDEVVVFGENPTIYELAKQAGTISYEIMTGISQRVQRIFYRE